MALKRKLSATSGSGRPAKVAKLTPAQTAAVNQAVTRKLNRTADWKCSTQSYSNASVDWSGYLWNVNANLTRGASAVNQFEGNKIDPFSVSLRYQLTCGDNTNMFRVILFQWMGDTHGVVPSGILDGNLLGTVSAPLTGYRWDNRPLVHVLYDKLHCMALSGYPGPDTILTRSVYIPSSKLRQIYMSSTVPEAQRGQLFLLVLSDSGAGSHPGILAYTCVTFKDQ